MKKIILLLTLSLTTLTNAYNLNLENTDLNTFVNITSNILDKKVLYYTDLQGSITLQAQNLTEEQIEDLLFSTINLNNYSIVKEKDFFIIDEKETNFIHHNENVVVDIINVDNINLSNISDTLNNFTSDYGFITQVEYSNSIIIADYENNFNNIKNILLKVDKEVNLTTKLYNLRIQSDFVSETINVYSETNPAYRNVSTIVGNDVENKIAVIAFENQISTIDKIVESLNVEIIEDINYSYKEIYEFNYIDYNDASDLFTNYYNDDNIYEMPFNQVLFVGTETDHQQFIELKNKVDIRQKQIHIQTIILEENITRSNSSGINIILTDETNYQLSSNLDIAPNINNLNNAISGGSLVLLPAGLDFSSIINYVNTNNDTNLLSKPEILVLNNKEASFSSGNVVPFRSSSGDTQTIERIDVSTQLTVTPRIVENNKVFIELNQIVSDVITSDDLVPTTSNREIETTLIIEDNQTILIGGIIQERTNKTENKIPLLNKIPYVGSRLFTSTNERKENLELKILLKVNIIDNYKNYD